MKNINRWIAIFFVLAVISVAVLWVGKPTRFVASDGLTDGQRDKVAFIESLRLLSTPDEIVLETSYLRALCASATEIELVFAASGVAIDGESPSLKRTFVCDQIVAAIATGELRVNLDEFRASYFPGELFPEKWILQGINVRGSSAFGVSEYEIAKVRGSSLGLEL